MLCLMFRGPLKDDSIVKLGVILISDSADVTRKCFSVFLSPIVLHYTDPEPYVLILDVRENVSLRFTHNSCFLSY